MKGFMLFTSITIIEQSFSCLHTRNLKKIGCCAAANCSIFTLYYKNKNEKYRTIILSYLYRKQTSSDESKRESMKKKIKI